MKVIVGLGNPGREYENTRHNVGFLVLDSLKDQVQSFQMNNKFHAEICQVGDVLLVKPQTFMNDSGKSVAAVAAFYKVDIDDLYVVHDDLDIVMGEFKIQKAKGPKIHNGVNDIEVRLGNKDFWRIRVGVDNRSQKSEVRSQVDQISNKLKSMIFPNRNHVKIPGRQYVLMKMNGAEKELLDSVVSEIARHLESKLGL